MNRIIRSALFAATSLAAIATGMPQEASAQSQMPGFFGSLSGWYAFDDGTRVESPNLPINNPGNGPGGKGYLGYRFNGSLDIAFGAQNTWLNAKRHDLNATTWVSDKARYWAVDAELGYNTIVNGLGVRLFAGLRYARFHHDNTLAIIDGLETLTGARKNEYSGIGPRVGTDFSARIGNSNFSIFGDIAGSMLFGRLKQVYSEVGCIGDCSLSTHHSQTVWNAEGQLGLAYEVSPGINLGIGYRGEYWRHVANQQIEFVEQGDFGFGRANRFMHGPFVRVAYNFGAPPAMPMMAAVTPPPGQPAMSKKAFIVFFDFDRSNITAEGQKTINDAAVAAKAGNAAQVSVTGHADRSGTEQYNLALSMRRAEVVKAGLIRLGVPASLIVVVAKGESQPLVNTADGVREPQNRRVEILI